MGAGTQWRTRRFSRVVAKAPLAAPSHNRRRGVSAHAIRGTKAQTIDTGSSAKVVGVSELPGAALLPSLGDSASIHQEFALAGIGFSGDGIERLTMSI